MIFPFVTSLILLLSGVAGATTGIPCPLGPGAAGPAPTAKTFFLDRMIRGIPPGELYDEVDLLGLALASCPLKVTGTGPAAGSVEFVQFNLKRLTARRGPRFLSLKLIAGGQSVRVIDFQDRRREDLPAYARA